MRRLLQVLTVILLVLSVTALVLGSLLFSKRELLKGRTQALERALVQLSALLEAPVDLEEKPAAFEERDIGSVGPQLVPSPDRASFWRTYPLNLESVDRPFATIQVGELMHYYKVDPITGKVAKDPATGYPITRGEGTMDATLQKLLGAATYQLDVLNQTRDQLRRVRVELADAVRDLNEHKQRLRQALTDIVARDNTISGLQDDVRRLERQVAGLEADKRNLQDQVAQLEAQVEEQREEIQLRDETIAQQRQLIQNLRNARPAGDTMISGNFVKNLVEAGRKATVVSVNTDWSYVVLELTDAFIAEIDAVREALAKNETPGIPVIELFIKRGDTFVAKAQLVQIRRDEKLAIADVLVDWQQIPVQPGDVAFY